MRDNKSNNELRISFAETLSGVTPSTPAAVDATGFNSVTYFVTTGTVTDAGTVDGITFEVQESDDDSTYTAVADADLIGLESGLSIVSDAADNQVVGKIGYAGAKRYTKLVATGTTGTNAVVSAYALLGHPSTAPVA